MWFSNKRWRTKTSRWQHENAVLSQQVQQLKNDNMRMSNAVSAVAVSAPPPLVLTDAPHDSTAPTSSVSASPLRSAGLSVTAGHNTSFALPYQPMIAETAVTTSASGSALRSHESRGVRVCRGVLAVAVGNKPSYAQDVSRDDRRPISGRPASRYLRPPAEQLAAQARPDPPNGRSHSCRLKLTSTFDTLCAVGRTRVVSFCSAALSTLCHSSTSYNAGRGVSLPNKYLHLGLVGAIDSGGESGFQRATVPLQPADSSQTTLQRLSWGYGPQVVHLGSGGSGSQDYTLPPSGSVLTISIMPTTSVGSEILVSVPLIAPAGPSSSQAPPLLLQEMASSEVGTGPALILLNNHWMSLLNDVQLPLSFDADADANWQNHTKSSS